MILSQLDTVLKVLLVGVASWIASQWPVSGWYFVDYAIHLLALGLAYAVGKGLLRNHRRKKLTSP
ncbi:hypothetical protein [Qipengyuania sp.]|uniref:hypothetical protein n=1 Tax=Qipengyuania sp. TaxID=2004515 RepID=UPI003D151286